MSADEDSARWRGFDFRPGDIVISTRSKSGTTWMQMICALLVFRTPDLPRPLAELSPWLDWSVTPKDDVHRLLEQQDHRRIIKTHTPLDGIPIDDRATYIVMGRDPLDVAVSLYHQSRNLDRVRLGELTGAPAGEPVGMGLKPWLREWIAWSGDHRERLDSLPGVLWHLDDAWSRRHRSNIVLVRYDDLVADLPAEMTRIAGVLGIDADDDLVDDLAAAAGFESMKARAEVLAPDPAGVMKDRSSFFRHGRSGSAAEVLTDADLGDYRSRAGELASADLLAWLHRG